jgi:nitroimidazol reductase NimA-like FMN-containing flavoprotein (pyridoxamine 5'-phosphate oxidase superfamily)
VVSEVGWQDLTKSECFRLLAGQQVGRVVLIDDRGPIALPVNFVLDRHTVLLRTGEGTKLDVAGRGAPVAFEVDGVDEATRTGWSVLVRGEATEVTDMDDLARVQQLPLNPLGARR